MHYSYWSWQNFVILFVLDGAWNAALAFFRTEKRAIRGLKWLDKKTANNKAHLPAMAAACFLYGIISVYGFFGSVRFMYQLRKQLKKGKKNVGSNRVSNR